MNSSEQYRRNPTIRAEHRWHRQRSGCGPRSVAPLGPGSGPVPAVSSWLSRWHQRPAGVSLFPPIICDHTRNSSMCNALMGVNPFYKANKSGKQTQRSLSGLGDVPGPGRPLSCVSSEQQCVLHHSLAWKPNQKQAQSLRRYRSVLCGQDVETK